MKTLTLAAAVGALALSGMASAAPVDLSGWTAQGGGNWVLQAGNNSVLQTINGRPTVFFGPGDAQGTKLSGTIRVQTTTDDDFIGFVLGFKSGDLSAGSTDFILIDWKQQTQSNFGCSGARGLAISRATAGLGDNRGAWCHSGNGVTELARASNLGSTGWADNTTYSFDLLFTASNIQVLVDGVKEIDVNGSFANGSFGFYNYSQQAVLYAGITEDILPPVPGVPEPASWAMLIAGFGLVGAASRRRRLLASHA
jgi:hypothetical protein